jgi:hypothetical protein
VSRSGYPLPCQQPHNSRRLFLPSAPGRAAVLPDPASCV